MDADSMTTTGSPRANMEKLGLGLDYHADVFGHGDKVLRAIHPQYEELFGELVDHPVIRELEAANLLVPTRRSSVALQGYGLVLEQPRIDRVTFPFEWTPTMFKEAAKAILRINQKLLPAGFCTQDGHLWNILFDGTQPKFIDFTSIVRVPAHGKWDGMDEFNRACITPLKLMEKGYPTVARTLCRDVRTAPDASLANAVLVNTRRYGRYPRGVRDVMKVLSVFRFFAAKGLSRIRHMLHGPMDRVSVDQIQTVIDRIDAMDVQPPPEMWSAYYASSTDYLAYTGKREELQAHKNSTPKHRVVAELLERTKPATVLDIACNRGVYSQLAALNGARVIGVDNDEQVLDEMYRDSVSLGTNTLPLYVNVTTPAEPVGFQMRPFPPVSERLKSDCVLCLALVHHLVLKSPNLTFPHIAEILASFTRKDLVVEFIPREDKYVVESLKKRSAGFAERFPWYTLENFKAALLEHFESLEQLESHPSPRVILLCRKK